MERLWAPWRGKYVTSGAEKTGGCVFCDALAGAQAADSLVVHQAALSFVVMNLYPYNSGHLMIAPKRHIGRLQEARPEELAEMMALARRLEGVLESLYRPQGLNLGMNLGQVAGAGVADHFHLHIVPRWSGDTNFMTVVGETRVIPEDPLDACRKLRLSFLDADQQ